MSGATAGWDVLVGAVLCVLGGLLLASRRRRQAAATGALLLATGTAWLLGSMFPAAVLLYRGPLIQLLVCHPRGRPARRLEQVVVGLGYLAAVLPVGRSNGLTVALALLVTGTVVAGRRRASGAEARARMVSSAACLVLMGVLGAGAAARLAEADVDPALGVVFEVALLACAAALFADARWGRWDRAAVAGLVVDLGDSGGPGTVRDKLAQALGDPGLELGFVHPGTGELVDETGRPVRISGAAGGRSRTRLRHDGQDRAVVVHAPGALDDPALLASVSALTSLAYANARLQAGVLARMTEIEASRRRVLEAADRERRALEAELRAGAERRLALVESLVESLEPPDTELTGLLRDARSSLQDFARGVHPRSLAAGGLAAACAELARQAPLPVRVDVPGVRLPAEVELSLYFVCAEGLTNVVKYAGASEAQVRLTVSGDVVELSVADDGCGGASLHGPGPDGGTGLVGLADRLAAIGGTLAIASAPGRGTTVRARLPGVSSTRRR